MGEYILNKSIMKGPYGLSDKRAEELFNRVQILVKERFDGHTTVEEIGEYVFTTIPTNSKKEAFVIGVMTSDIIDAQSDEHFQQHHTN